MSDNLQFAVVGYGNRGRSHQRGFEELGAYCVAVCDPRPPQDDEAARYGNRYYDNYKQLLRKEKALDFVVVASQEAQHVDHALACLRKGLPVYLEKAPAHTWRAAVRLYRQVKKRQYPLFVGYNLRRFPAALAAEKVLRDGAIGKVQHVLAHVNKDSKWGSTVFYRTFYGDAAASGDIVLAKLTHDTEWIQYVLGTTAATCSASAAQVVWKNRPDAPIDARYMEGCDPDGNYTSHDTATVTGRLANGALYTVVFTTSSPMSERRFVFNGSLGQLDVSLHSDRPSEPKTWAQLWRCGGEPVALEITEGHGGHGGADGLTREDFLAWLAGSPDGPSEPESILNGMIIPTAGLDSVRTGRTIDCAARLAKAMASAEAETAAT